jgi:hypothetical protein
MSEERAKGLEDERLVGGRKECEATDDIADDGLRGGDESGLGDSPGRTSPWPSVLQRNMTIWYESD